MEQPQDTADQILQQAQAAFDAAQILKDNGQTQQAIERFRLAEKQFDNIDNITMYATSIHMIGVCQLMERDYDQAVSTLKQAADLYQQQRDNHGLGNVYRDLGLAFFHRKQYDQARYWLDLSAQHLGKTDEKASLGITLAKSGLLFKELHQWDKSNLLFKQALTLIREQGHWFFEATTLIDWAFLAYKKKDFHQTITKLWAALGLIYQAQAQEQQQRRLAEIYGILAISYLRLNNTTWAINLLHTSLQYLKQMPEPARAPVMKFAKIQKFLKKLYQQDVNLYRQVIQESPLPELSRMPIT
jgi:tetratricopeptide (TPR) repeat protein